MPKDPRTKKDVSRLNDFSVCELNCSAFLVQGAGERVEYQERILKPSQSAVVRINIGENACARFIARPKNSLNIEREFVLGNGAKLEFFEFTENGTHLSSTKIILSGAHARVQIKAGFFCRDREELNIHHLVYHEGEQTSSEIQAFGVLDDKAKAVYRGNIVVASQAKKITAREEARILLLSDSAKIETRPDLEIGNNDVISGHSVSISRLDTEKMFYFMSRGVPREVAKQMAIEAHLAPLSISRESGLFIAKK